MNCRTLRRRRWCRTRETENASSSTRSSSCSSWWSKGSTTRRPRYRPPRWWSVVRIRFSNQPLAHVPGRGPRRARPSAQPRLLDPRPRALRVANSPRNQAYQSGRRADGSCGGKLVENKLEMKEASTIRRLARRRDGRGNGRFRVPPTAARARARGAHVRPGRAIGRKSPRCGGMGRW